MASVGNDDFVDFNFTQIDSSKALDLFPGSGIDLQEARG